MASNGVITIKFVEGNDRNPGPQPINDKMETTSGGGDKSTAASKNSTAKTAGIALTINKAAQDIKSITLGQANRQINRYFMLKDSYLSEQKMNNALQIVGKTNEIGSGIAAGFLMGGVVGAAVMAVVEGIKLTVDIANNYKDEAIGISVSNTQVQFNRQRAGYSLTAGSIGENR